MKVDRSGLLACSAIVFLLARCTTLAGVTTGAGGPHDAEQWNEPVQRYVKSFQQQTSDPRADLFGCGPAKEKHKVINPKGQHPTPEPTSGKALIYIIRKSRRFGTIPQNKLAANGQWVAVLKRGNYSFFTVDPGLVKLCYAGDRGLQEGSGFLYLTAEAGKIYYLRGDTGALGQRTELLQLSEEEGKFLVADSEYVTFTQEK